jgi:hypothetical protein
MDRHAQSNYDNTPTAAGKKKMLRQKQFERDAVSEASWESFPASDAPSWIGRSPAEALAARDVTRDVNGG